MAVPIAPFYFTRVDPDYSIKGSRDPLGFQVLWQHQARQLIPYLSTVSGNVLDFQVMCLAYYLYGQERDSRFISFFLRFEQLMAFTRYQYGRGRFNGVDRVSRKINEGGKLSISNTSEDEILSNQRAYGIWGKYNRPFQDIGFLKDPRFETIFENKVKALPERDPFERLVKQILERPATKISIDDLAYVNPLLDITQEEQSFFTEKILLLQRANPYQNQLHDYLHSTSIPDDFYFYPFLQAFKSSTFASDDSLQHILAEIEGTEKILAPLNRIFRYLQTRPLWAKSDLEVDTYLEQVKEIAPFVFLSTSEENKTKNELSLALQKSNWSMIEFLVKRNLEITTLRGGAPWLTLSGDILEVHHGDGGFQDPDFNPMADCDNHYFLDTYLTLFRQLNPTA